MTNTKKPEYPETVALCNGRYEQALKSLNADVWADQRGKLPDKELIECLLCDLQRVEDILTGKPFFDYDRQVFQVD